MKYIFSFIFIAIIIFSVLNILRVTKTKAISNKQIQTLTPALITDYPTPTYENEIIETPILWSLIQEWRVLQGFEPYLEDSRLCNLAEIRVKEIVAENNHNGFWLHTRDFSHNGLGENISSEWLYEKPMLNAWLESPTHRKNLDASYTYSCLACENNYCVQIFGNF